MAIRISAQNLSISYPVFGLDSRSFKREILNVSTGGKFSAHPNGKSVEVTALSELSFDFFEGDKVALIGHNGAGKTTLLRVLAGVYEATSGKLASTGSIGSLFDATLGMDYESTGYENVRIRGILLGMSKQEINSVILDVEEFTELGHFLKMPIRTYSSGMLLRLAFSLSTLRAPDIFLIDEVISAGDAGFMKKAEARLSKLIQASKILVLASHSNETVARICNKAMWLEHGHIKKYGDINEVIELYAQASALLAV